jgi:ketosteroid isomerase-like protein
MQPAGGDLQEELMDGATVATAIFDAVQAGDLASFRARCAEEMVIWHNHDMAERSLDRLIADLELLHSVTDEVAYIDRRYQSIADGAWVQHVLTGKTLHGRPYALATAVRLFIDTTGRITRIEEYSDSAASKVFAGELGTELAPPGNNFA